MGGRIGQLHLRPRAGGRRGGITPWNYPLYQVSLKVAAALAAGCTVVLKPSEVAPINAFILADIIDEVGLPRACSISSRDSVPSSASDRGAPEDRHGLVHGIDARRKTRDAIGRRDGEAGLARTGGKSANVILEDAIFPRPSPTESSSATSTPVRPARAHANGRATFEAGRGRGHRRGDVRGFAPSDPSPDRACSATRQRRSTAARARLHQQGHRRRCATHHRRHHSPEVSRRFYVQPTIFSDVRTDMTIAQEEIFVRALDHSLDRRRGHRHRQ